MRGDVKNIRQDTKRWEKKLKKAVPFMKIDMGRNTTIAGKYSIQFTRRFHEMNKEAFEEARLENERLKRKKMMKGIKYHQDKKKQWFKEHTTRPGNQFDNLDWNNLAENNCPACNKPMYEKDEKMCCDNHKYPFYMAKQKFIRIKRNVLAKQESAIPQFV
jgi:hypothetical protein